MATARIHSTLKLKPFAGEIIDEKEITNLKENFKDGNPKNILGKGEARDVILVSYHGTNVAAKRYPYPENVEHEWGMLEACFPSEFVVTGYAYSLEPLTILMEYMEQGSLDGFIKNPSLNFLQRIQIAIDIASGLNHLRNKGIVHHDIKPKNVLLYQTESGIFRAKICDFGLATKIPDKATADTVIGSAKYYVLDEKLSFAKDIYSFGILLFDLFVSKQTVKMVFPKSEGVQQIYMRIALGKVRESLEKVCRAMETDPIFKPIAELILLCTVKNHEERPAPDKIIATLNALLAKKEFHHLKGSFSMPKPIPNSPHATKSPSLSQKNMFVEMSAPDDKSDSNSDCPFVMTLGNSIG